MKESDLQRVIQKEARKLGCYLFRNQVGTYKIDCGRVIKSGLCKGSADLIGWITRDGVAVFVSVEVKTATGRLAPQQRRWMEAVQKAGGIAGVVRSIEDLRELLS